jgi:hypothetical protein
MVAAARPKNEQLKRLFDALPHGKRSDQAQLISGVVNYRSVPVFCRRVVVRGVRGTRDGRAAFCAFFHSTSVRPRRLRGKEIPAILQSEENENKKATKIMQSNNISLSDQYISLKYV